MPEVTPLRRLARVVQELLASPYAHAKREVEIGHVMVNGDIVSDPGALVAEGDEVAHDPNRPRRRRPQAAPPVEVLYLDDDLVVVLKPAGLLVHPTWEGERDTLVARTAAAIQRRTGRPGRPLVVHRLDRDTSGVVVLARRHDVATALQAQFRTHAIERRYLALVAGDFDREQVVERNIGRPRAGARRAALRPGAGQPAKTVLRAAERFGKATLVEAELHTGRTHQVRVHLSYLGHPVLGDAVYGDPRSDPVEVPRLALHAAHLSFLHPGKGELMTFRAAFPADLLPALGRLRRAPSRADSPAPPATGAGATPPPPPRSRPPRGGGAGPRKAAAPTRRRPPRDRSRW